MNWVSGVVALPHDRLSQSQKVTRTSVHSQRLLFQLDVFSEQLWLEAANLVSSCWGVPATPVESGLFHSLLGGGGPWAPVLLVTHRDCGSNGMSAGTGVFEVQNLVKKALL